MEGQNVKKTLPPHMESDGNEGSRNGTKLESAALPVFGVAVSVAAERMPSTDDISLPVVFRECIDYIEECGLTSEGIYRVSGFKTKVDALKASYNRHESPNLRAYGPHVASSLLKLFLRELPGSLLTPKLVKKFDEVSVVQGVERREKELLSLLNEIPKTNKLCLSWLIVHLSHVLQHAEVNKVTREQLITVMSTPMQMSHRVLEVFLDGVPTLFQGVKIIKYRRPGEIGDSIAKSENVRQSESKDSQSSGSKNGGGMRSDNDIAAGGEHTTSHQKPKFNLHDKARLDKEKAVDETDAETKAMIERLRNYLERNYITQEQRDADPELNMAILEEKALIIQQEEMLDLCDELKRKCIVQREEIERLMAKAKLERDKRLLAGDSSTSSILDTTLPKDVGKLTRMLIDLQESNGAVEKCIWSVVDEITVHQEACVDIRVQLRLMQNADLNGVKILSLAETRALPDFDKMF